MNDASQRVDANAVETVQRRQQTEVYISRLSAVIRLCADVFPEGKVDARTLVLCRQTNGSHQNGFAVNIVFIIFIFIITLFFSLGSQSIPLILHFLYPFAS